MKLRDKVISIIFLSVRFLPLIVFSVLSLELGLSLIISPTVCFFTVNILSIWLAVVMIYMSYCAIISGNRINEAERIDYKTKWETEKTPSSIHWDDVHLYYLLPNYREKVDIMKATLRRLCETRYIDLKKQVTVILCMEGREKEHAQKAEQVRNAHIHDFFDILVSAHPPNLPGEVPGKGSNLAYACKHVLLPHLTEHEFDKDKVLVMCTDADMLVHPKFLGAVFERFCNSAPRDRYRCTWGGPLLMDLNLYETPAPTRIMSLMANNTQLNFVGDSILEHVAQSTFVISFLAVEEVDFWSVDYIAEDYHLYCKCKLHFRGDFRAHILALPICGYGLDSGSYVKTLKDRWSQARRHALGMVEIVYVIREIMKGLLFSGRLVMSPLKIVSLLYHLSFHHFITFSQFLTLQCFMFFLGYVTSCENYPIFSKIPFGCTAASYYYGILNNPWVYYYTVIQTVCGIPFMGLMFVHARYSARSYWNKGFGTYLTKFAYFGGRNFLETMIWGPIAVIFYGVLPTLYEAVNLCFTEKFGFFVAGKESKIVGGNK